MGKNNRPKRNGPAGAQLLGSAEVQRKAIISDTIPAKLNIQPRSFNPSTYHPLNLSHLPPVFAHFNIYLQRDAEL
jgi:hypothetical protein